MPNAVFVTADLRDLKLDETFKEYEFSPPFDLVLSDMAPKTTGIRFADQARSLELCQLALQISHTYLKTGGHFVCKLFHSQEFEVFRNELRQYFEKIEILRPKSTRKESKEIFLIGIKKKPIQQNTLGESLP
jgi:23S rRNA (uridine2552-2'-O)-methyltransferase